MHSILVHLTPTFKFNIKNSHDLALAVRGKTLPDNYVLVSFDVKSLFNSIPHKLIFDIFQKRWHEMSNFTNINKDTFLQLVSFCIEASYFLYEGHYYKQLRDTPMGAPLSPILANNLVMHKLMELGFSNLNFHLPFLFVYVVDTLAGSSKK